MGVPLSAPGYGLLRMLKVFASTNSTGTPSGSIYLAFQLVYSNFCPKYSMTRKEKVKHKNSLYRFYLKEPLSSIDDWEKGLCQRPIHSRLAPSLRIKNFGWREPQNAESPSVGSWFMFFNMLRTGSVYCSEYKVTVSCTAYFKRENPMRRMRRWRLPEKHRTKNYASSKKGWIGTFTKLNS